MKLTLPSALAHATLFKRGALLRLTMDFGERGSREKYAVVVNVDIAADPVLLVLMTSQLGWYDDHPMAPGFVRLKARSVQTLVKETIVNCRELHAVPHSLISERYAGKTLEYCEQVPAQVLLEINAALAAAPTLSARERASVVPVNASEGAAAAGAAPARK